MLVFFSAVVNKQTRKEDIQIPMYMIFQEKNVIKPKILISDHKYSHHIQAAIPMH